MILAISEISSLKNTVDILRKEGSNLSQTLKEKEDLISYIKRDHEELLDHRNELQDSINTFNRIAFGRITGKSKSKEKIAKSSSQINLKNTNNSVSLASSRGRKIETNSTNSNKFISKKKNDKKNEEEKKL